MKLVLNRVKYKLAEEISDKLFFSKTDKSLDFCLRKKELAKKLKDEKFNFWCQDKNDDEKIYFGFEVPKSENNYVCLIPKYFIPKYIRFILKNAFLNRGMIVNYRPNISDLNVFMKKESGSAWDKYYRFDIMIHDAKSELSISVGSEDTLISNKEIPYNTTFKTVKYVDNANLIKKYDDQEKCRFVANREIRHALGYDGHRKLQYKNNYELISDFYNNYVRDISNINILFTSVGLRNAELREVSKVRILENKMVFKDEKVDINPITGMRDFGVFKASPKAYDTQFIFFYRNRNDANSLYGYLKNGYKNFPGLERYVGIPIVISNIKGFCYENKRIEEEYEKFEREKLTDTYYNNLFAIVIGDFDKNNTDDEKTDSYYNIKKSLLLKGIPSQFVNETHIRQTMVFNYHLPNIAIGILAKLGGIPWRLKNHPQKELVIGFNQAKLDDKSYVGSSVFFTNDGLLENVYSYPKSSPKEMIELLRRSILSYMETNGDIDRLVIHYYKTNSSKETKSIENLLYNELKVNVSYAIVEINDSKSQNDICFDADYNWGMPISGTYVEIGQDEYLLFNNTRHIDRPLTRITDELPIKIKIHHADNSGFSLSEIISQIYEFSRLVWKGLKQRSQPATIIYSKLIADFSAHFNGDIPSNELTKHTPWFV